MVFDDNELDSVGDEPNEESMEQYHPNNNSHDTVDDPISDDNVDEEDGDDGEDDFDGVPLVFVSKHTQLSLPPTLPTQQQAPSDLVWEDTAIQTSWNLSCASHDHVVDDVGIDKSLGKDKEGSESNNPCLWHIPSFTTRRSKDDNDASSSSKKTVSDIFQHWQPKTLAVPPSWAVPATDLDTPIDPREKCE
ncbi:hypothetical protein IV203_025058 [Nitzschia inconspicua]|uniref:Uncharacterized protein n=1 Tax=Nitzschia inconspicua TaxID=303405 RepID=A0A9K3KAP0_9STRA|nr:hypothetical protein IV203_025194 [Nitzschia inconspicua]KAG7365617.1 hypothetical protein IV203_025058 [Nitzschia inconspicua]